MIKLTDKAAQALTNLRGNRDFDDFKEWLKEHEAKEIQRSLDLDGVQCARAQGAVKLLQEIADAIAAAPDTVNKFKQRQVDTR